MLRKFFPTVFTMLCVLLLAIGSGCGKAQEPQKLSLDKGKKTLVVFYSATGTTEKIAGYITEALNADVLRLEPKEPYTGNDLNYRNRSSRVCKEHDDESLRRVALVKNTVDNWNDYGTVFVGYPIWWGIAAWPVNDFIQSNDFTGKTVIPFSTSISSGFGRSGELLSKLAGTGNWAQGENFFYGSPKDEITAWLKAMGF